MGAFLAFIVTPIARWIAGGLIITTVIGGLYVKGRTDGKAACELRQQQQMAKVEKYVKEIRERIERRLPDDVDAIMRPDTFQRNE